MLEARFIFDCPLKAADCIGYTV